MKKVHDDQDNFVEKSPELLCLYVDSPSGHTHILYVERTPSGAYVFDCNQCDYFNQVPRTVSDDELLNMQYATISYLQNTDPGDIDGNS